VPSHGSKAVARWRAGRCAAGYLGWRRPVSVLFRKFAVRSNFLPSIPAPTQTGPGTARGARGGYDYFRPARLFSQGSKEEFRSPLGTVGDTGDVSFREFRRTAMQATFILCAIRWDLGYSGIVLDSGHRTWRPISSLIFAPPLGVKFL